MNKEPLLYTKSFIGQNNPQCFVSNISNGSVVMCTACSPVNLTMNQDASALLPIGLDSSVFVLADGAGGMRGGSQASSLVIEILSDSINKAVEVQADLRDAILNGIEQANLAIMALGIGAGSTISVVEQNGMTIRSYHVGDSDVIVMGQRGRLKHHTIAHSPVGYAIEAGLLDENEALHHNERHLISNILGSNDMHIAIGPTIELAENDTVLLASDGLTDNLSIDAIIDIVRIGKLSSSVRKLFKHTLEHMKNPPDLAASKADDLTIIAFRPKPFRK